MARGRRRSVLPSLLFCGQYFVDVDLHSSFSKLADARERSVDFLLPTVYFRHNPGSGYNAEGLAAFNFVWQSGQTGLRFGPFDLTHGRAPPTSNFLMSTHILRGRGGFGAR